MDTNDGGNTSNICGASPCNITGSYSYSSSGNTGSLTFADSGGTQSQGFDFFVANGTASGNTLTLYAISNDPSTNPPVLGTIAIQDTKLTYNNKTFTGNSISALTGAGGNVSLTLGAADGTSSGTGGTGNFYGQFDQNNDGTILSVSAFPSASQSTNPYTYVATQNGASSSYLGRYIFYMLGNPNASTPVAPIPFILYANAANSGFLLECNIASCSNPDTTNAVITGTMTPQQGPKASGGFFTNAAITGTYAVATNSNTIGTPSSCGAFAACYLPMNLLLTSPGQAAFNVNGVVNGTAVTGGTYDIKSGVGTISVTTGSNSNAVTANYVWYGTGAGYYLMEEETSSKTPVPSQILYMAQ
jgi:hypothetical protein